ncbi:MAG: amidohydrolase family protein [Chloroflexi bacterium]|nr:amidohydrolase family protein [Chloroflexota bacterium]
MATWDSPVIDCDGHLIESIPELAEFMDPSIRRTATNPGRNRSGVFPSIDGIHYPRENEIPDDQKAKAREYVQASEHRKGSGEDIVAFQERVGIETSILFASEALSVGFIQQSDYAIHLCRAYNDYVAERYRKVSDTLYPMGILPMQNAEAAAEELRRMVRELDLKGAMLPSLGMPLHFGHDYYWPVYEAAAELGAVLGIHGGSSLGFGADTFTNSWAARSVRHPVPLLLALTSMVNHGVLDRSPDFKIGFFEGGAAWPVLLLDRMERDDEVYTTGTGTKHSLRHYFESGQVLIGCEGNEDVLTYIKGKVGVEAFAWASDYPHEVDVVAASHMISETFERSDMSAVEKAAIMGGNAKRFFGL